MDALGCFWKIPPIKNVEIVRLSLLFHSPLRYVTQGAVNHPFWRDQTMQIYDHFKGVPLRWFLVPFLEKGSSFRVPMLGFSGL